MTLLVSDFSDVTLPQLPAVPGMISAAECRYLYWLAATQLTGAGQLVEVGTWLGRSTLHIAAGLKRSGHPRRLYCFDGYTWGATDGKTADLPLKPGESFQKYFEANISPFADLVTVQRTRIAKIAWSGEPVELLFLDAPKKHSDITRCLEVFGPCMFPGKSIIAIQDYLYFPAYALAACIYALRDCLKLRHVVVGGSTVAFQVTRPIDLQRHRPSDWTLTGWSAAQVHASWDAILEPLPPEARERIEPGRALHLYDCGAKAEATAAMKALSMTPFQQQKFAGLSKSHHYLSYPDLFTAAGFPGSAKQNLLSRGKRVRDWVRSLHTAG